MKKTLLTILGVATLIFALTLNFRHALDDYGVLKNKLHVEVLAQSNNTGGSSSGGGSSGGSSSGGDSSGGGNSGGGSSGGGSNIDCGNPTFIKNEALRQRTCIIQISYRLTCIPEDGVCCDPSKQTSCSGYPNLP